MGKILAPPLTPAEDHARMRLARAASIHAPDLAQHRAEYFALRAQSVLKAAIVAGGLSTEHRARLAAFVLAWSPDDDA